MDDGASFMILTATVREIFWTDKFIYFSIIDLEEHLI